jgi:putative CocE/NonD family hydrolase
MRRPNTRRHVRLAIGMIALLGCVFSAAIQAQELHAAIPAHVNDDDTARVIRDLAIRTLPVYEDKDSLRYLANLSALQLASGNYKAAADTRQTLRDRRRKLDANQPPGRTAVFDVMARAMALTATESLPLDQAYERAFAEIASGLSDRDAFALASWLALPVSEYHAGLRAALEKLGGRSRISVGESIDLVRRYVAYEAYSLSNRLIPALAAADQARRYDIEDGIVLARRGNTELTALRLVPRNRPGPLPTLLQVTLPGDTEARNEAAAAAAHGYAAVVVRLLPVERADGKRDEPLPFQSADWQVRSALAWLADQPWQDGRIGMIGSRYSGFTAWSAARSSPQKLTAIATLDPMAPGIDFPGQGRIMHNAAYRWALSLAGVDTPLDLDRRWYESRRPYRDLERMGPARSLAFHRWLDHPSYDGYWQKMIPYGEEFAKVAVPVLTVSGYYAPGQPAALYYFDQHRRHRSDADHTLLLGPYDGELIQGWPRSPLGGITLPSSALIDLRELRYRWLDAVFNKTARPAPLEPGVVFMPVGADNWRHAASLDAMSPNRQRLYLDNGGRPFRLTSTEPKKDQRFEQRIRFDERGDAETAAATADDTVIVTDRVAAPHSLVYIGDPIEKPLELSGPISGVLDFESNRMDFDFNLRLYAQQPGGDYVQLCSPYELRASYAADRSQRQLFKAGVRQQLAFSSERLGSLRLPAGSRIVLALGINKRADRQLNMGSGHDIKRESPADGGTSMRIRWYGSSYVDLPLSGG